MNVGGITVRELAEGDVAAFRELRAQALEDHPEWFGEPHEVFVRRPIDDVARSMASDRTFTIGAFEGEKLVGIARCSRSLPSSRDAHKAQVTSVYVDPIARGRGVGRALMNELMSAAARWTDVEELRLAVVIENRAARALYRSLGFGVYAVEPRAMKIGNKYVDEEHMFLLLNRNRR